MCTALGVASGSGIDAEHACRARSRWPELRVSRAPPGPPVAPGSPSGWWRDRSDPHTPGSVCAGHRGSGRGNPPQSRRCRAVAAPAIAMRGADGWRGARSHRAARCCPHSCPAAAAVQVELQLMGQPGALGTAPVGAGVLRLQARVAQALTEAEWVHHRLHGTPPQAAGDFTGQHLRRRATSCHSSGAGSLSSMASSWLRTLSWMATRWWSPFLLE